MSKNYATFTKAFEKTEKVLASSVGRLSDDGFGINLSGIADVLIQDCGRFAESYASDFFVGWDEIRELVKSRYVTEPEVHVKCFGIRDSGVDHNEFVLSRLRNTLQPMSDLVSVRSEYRRLLAVGVFVTPSAYGGEADVRVELKNLTNEISRLEPEDRISWDSSTFERLKQNLFLSKDNVEEFLEYELNEDEDADVIDNRLDQAIAQKTNGELYEWATKVGMEV